jgi:serine phosphatase RsbU (regulator of sigma subunit)
LSVDDRSSGAGGDRGDDSAAGEAPGDPLIGATLEGLRRAAEEVEHVAAVAETLQRSLLPERLPELPGLGLSARYVPGSADAQVGGDWYDVIVLRNGQAGIAIGDVVGHGLDAAARMARLQNALRAYALEGLRPSLVLERMNGFAREVSGGPMATLLYGIVDPDEGRLRLATAGHPPVLVIGPDGDAYFAEGPAGSPLGVVPFPSYEESTIPLVPGSTVLLYTDGLVERPEASLDEGLEWLSGFASGVAADPDELCGALLQARFRDAPGDVTSPCSRSGSSRSRSTGSS